jgi:hypothetical protein
LGDWGESRDFVRHVARRGTRRGRILAVEGAAVIARPRWRKRLAAAFVISALAVQIGFALNGYRDPHKFFAFQPFNESSTWKADIVRVTWDGERVPVEAGWNGYEWDALVHTAPLKSPFRLRPAYMGVDASVDFLDDALDWVATHTPDDRDTRYLEATVTYFRNTRGPEQVVLRSVERPAPS